MHLAAWDDSTAVTFDRELWAELTSLRFLTDAYNVLVMGPVGVGKTLLANALGHIAVRRHRYRASPIISHKLPGANLTGTQTPPTGPRKSIVHAEPRLDIATTGSKHGTQSTCGLMPCPGKYALTTTRAGATSHASRSTSSPAHPGSGGTGSRMAPERRP